MKVVKREDGIDLIPESEFERDCLKHINGKSITRMGWEDSWDQKGDYQIRFNDDPYSSR